MNLFIASDHAAFETKKLLSKWLEATYPEFHLIDLGTDSLESTHYPQYAQKLAEQMQKDLSSKGILLCGSGIGVSMVANRFKGIRAALCRSIEDAKLAREHNDANVLCLGARSTSVDLMKQMIEVFFKSQFEAGRHLERVKMFSDLGE